MTNDQYGFFLSSIAAIAAVGAILNLLRLKKRGASALLMALAFLLLGLLAWEMKMKAGQNLLTAIGICIGALLIGDLFLRARAGEKRP